MIDRRTVIAGLSGVAATGSAIGRALASGPRVAGTRALKVKFTPAALRGTGHPDFLPFSASRVLLFYAWGLVHTVPADLHDEHQAHLVARLPGTTRCRETELRRSNFIALETVRRINAYACRHAMKREDLATRCEQAGTVGEALTIMREVVDLERRANKGIHGAPGNAVLALEGALDYARNYKTYSPPASGLPEPEDYALAVCGHASNVASCTAWRSDSPEAFAAALGILDGAFRLERNRRRLV